MTNWQEGQELKQGRYIVDRFLGEGGYGVTYLATDTSSGESVVLKTLNRKCRSRPDFLELQERFVNEALALASCRHEYIVRVYPQMFQDDKVWCMVMEYIPGQNLRDYLDAQGKLSEAEALDLIERLGNALSYVHEQGLLHRDVKLSNVLLRDNILSAPVLIDFGLAREYEAERSRSMTNVLTEGFAPLEQYDSRGRFGPWTDVYALAASLYVILTGELPLPSQFRQHAPEAFRPPQYFNPEIGDRVDAAIRAGMALEASDRPQSVREWLALLKSDAAPPARAVAAPGRRSPEPSPSPESRAQRPAPDDRTRQQSARPARVSGTPLPPTPSKKKARRLPTFEFEVVAIDLIGEIVECKQRQASYFPEDLGNSVLLEMVTIAGGEFLMGSPDAEKFRDVDESPQHPVRVPPFLLGKYPVTQAQWRAVSGMPKVKQTLEADPSANKGRKLPVERVSWYDALEFCARLSRHTGRAYRLPSEAEWEYACRAGSATPFACGDTITGDLANYNANYTYAIEPEGENRGETTTVGSFPPNRFGLYDMHGNIAEWVRDRYRESYDGAPNDGSAWVEDETGNDTFRATLRGGSWNVIPWDCRSAARNSLDPSYRSNSVGFRVACTPPNRRP